MQAAQLGQMACCLLYTAREEMLAGGCMKTRMSVIGATLATLFAASAFASTPAMDAAVSMTVDAGAPIRATLLPTVKLEATQATSEANPAKMSIADTAPLEVTLLPTVRVTAREPALATTL